MSRRFLDAMVILFSFLDLTSDRSKRDSCDIHCCLEFAASIINIMKLFESRQKKQ